MFPITLEIKNSNYSNWASCFKSLCGKFGLKPHIDGTLAADPTDPNWDQADCCVKSWIFGFIDDLGSKGIEFRLADEVGAKVLKMFDAGEFDVATIFFALLVGVAIPGSFLAAILLLDVMGFTMNIVVLFSLILVMFGAFQGSGHTVPVMAVNMGRLWLVRIPFSWLLAVKLELGPSGLWWAMNLSNVIAAAAALALVATILLFGPPSPDGVRPVVSPPGPAAVAVSNHPARGAFPSFCRVPRRSGA